MEEPITSQEFFEQLKTNTLKPVFTLKGVVKKSDKDNEVLFAKKGDLLNWVKIPSTMIESAHVLKNFSKEAETFTVVKLHLKTPATPEGKTLYELLTLFGKEETCEGKFDWKNKMNKFGHCGMHKEPEHVGHHCGCGCHHDHPFGCSCHGEHHCNCGCHQEYGEEFNGNPNWHCKK